MIVHSEPLSHSAHFSVLTTVFQYDQYSRIFILVPHPKYRGTIPTHARFMSLILSSSETFSDRVMLPCDFAMFFMIAGALEPAITNFAFGISRSILGKTFSIKRMSQSKFGFHEIFPTNMIVGVSLRNFSCSHHPSAKVLFIVRIWPHQRASLSKSLTAKVFSAIRTLASSSVFIFIASLSINCLKGGRKSSAD